MQWRRLRPAAVALLLFVIWSLVVRIGLSGGSRRSAFVAHPFGSWPAAVGSLGGAGDLRFSVYVTYGANETLGSTTPGSTDDTGDAGNINGSRFVTGSTAGEARSISVYVAGPVDASPRDQFQAAIYTDAKGAPGSLLASSATGRLTTASWNTVPIAGRLRAGTPYWLLYNTNGASSAVNNMAYTSAATDPLDRVIRAPRSDWVRHAAVALATLANPGSAALLALCLVLWLGRKRWRAGMSIAVAFGLALLLEAVLKYSVFYPFESYPSGHAIRAVFLAASLSQLTRRRGSAVAGWLAALLVCLAVVYSEGHFAEEVIGGALAGWALASGVTACISMEKAPLVTRQRH
jgi:membrane-associated phospholipid phosphatase